MLDLELLRSFVSVVDAGGFTRAGERLLSYARRLLALAEEARDVMARPGSEGAVKLGIPEDFAAYRLAELLATFSRSRPGLRLDVRADQSTYLRRDIQRGDPQPGAPK